jgi:hypothetical protein
MTLVIFLAAIIVSLLLRHQQRRHALELTSACDRHGISVPDLSPKIPVLESALTVLVGLALILPAGVALLGAFSEGNPSDWASVWEVSAAGFAVGLALVALGGRALLVLRHGRAAPRGSDPPGS